MGKLWNTILDLAEVWALLIPLLVLLTRRNLVLPMPVIVYLFAALLLNTIGDAYVHFKILPDGWLERGNNALYNIHSVVRFTCFSRFFISMKQPYYTRLRHLVPVVFVGFLLVNFSLFEDFFNPLQLSGNLLALEAYLLLLYSMLYYLGKLNEDDLHLFSSRNFWVVTGLAVYVVTNFCMFLFYEPIMQNDLALAERFWNVHNIAFILLCLFITKALYVSAPARS